MSDIEVSIQTQRIEVNPPPASVEVPVPASAVSTVLAGPPGPPGPPGSIESSDLTPIFEEIDTKIATHNQTAPIHMSATSGRDFAAVFQNGLI